MQEIKMLIDKTGISKKLLELGLPESKSNNKIEALNIIESFWVSTWIDCFKFSHKAVVKLNEVLCKIFGWKRVTGKKITSLFKLDDIEEEKVYITHYHAFVTNQILPAIEIWEQYKRRGDEENRIKELKEDFGLQGFCIDDFCTTGTAMRLVMIAYNLMSLFNQLTLQKQPSPTLATLRINCFAVGSCVENMVLKLSVPLKRRQ